MIVTPSAAAVTDLLDRVCLQARRTGDDHLVPAFDILAEAHKQRTVSTSTAFRLVLALIDPSPAEDNPRTPAAPSQP